jgi:MoaA/NifB/PqqE/SkfB family radical SAM enzyme
MMEFSRNDDRVAEMAAIRAPERAWGFETAAFQLRVRNLGLAELSRSDSLGRLFASADLHRADGTFVRTLARRPFPRPVLVGGAEVFDVALDVKAFAGDYEVRWGLQRENGAGLEALPVGAPSTPVRVENTIFEAFVELINACNFRCTFCPQTTLQRKQRPMAFELATKVVRDLAEMGHHHPIRCHLLGEPLLYPRFFDFVEATHGMGQRLLLATNGSRFQERNVEGIFRSRLDEMLVSLNTPEEELYNAQRGTRVPYAEYLAGITRMVSELVRRGPPPATRINILYERARAEDPQEQARVRRIADDWIGVVRSVSGRALPDAQEAVHLDPTRTALLRLCEGLDLQWTPYHNWGEGGPPAEHFCVFPWKQLAVLVDGQATMCCVDAEGEIRLGDANVQTIAEIWNGPKLQRLREGFLRQTAFHPRCRRCDVRHEIGEFFP